MFLLGDMDPVEETEPVVVFPLDGVDPADEMDAVPVVEGVDALLGGDMEPRRPAALEWMGIGLVL